MSSWSKRNPEEVSIKTYSIIEEQVCWEFLTCSKVLCPAHGERSLTCWTIPKTHCSDEVSDDFFKKLSLCLVCPYFKKISDQDPRGWNYFLAEQVRQYNFKALTQIYQKEESFINILDRIPDGLFTIDQEWRITYFNPAAEKITGFSIYDAVGMYCKDVLKNPICETDCALKRAVVSGTNTYHQEQEITNIEGKKIPIICSTSVFLDDKGRITGGIEIFKDITESRNLQEEIVRREKKYRRIFESSNDMIYITNRRGTILDVNQAGVDLLGYNSKEELMGIRSASHLYRSARERGHFMERINRDGLVKDFEVDLKKKDKTPIHVLISSRRHENVDTREIEFEGIIKDITLRKRAEQALKQRNRELSILNTIALGLNLTMDLSQILKMTLKNIVEMLHLRQGALFLIDREKKKAFLQERYGLPAQDLEKSDQILFKDLPLMKFLLEEDLRLPPKPKFPPFHVTYQAKGGKLVPWLSNFLITSRGKPLGFFGLVLPPLKTLSTHEIHLLCSLGNFLGGAIENTELIETIRRHRHELRKLTEKLFQSQEEERRRIARELHDEAGQALTAIKLSLDRMEGKVSPDNQILKEEIDQIRKALTRTSLEIRELSYRLHPTLLIDLGLEPALDLYLKGVANQSGLNIDFRMLGFDRRIDADIETVLYRFSQEALTNTLKHSGAESFHLSIIKSSPKIIFLAEDDGIGFHGQIEGNSKRSLGLLGMRERASLLGGTFQLRTSPDRGTRIRIEIPVYDTQSYGKTD